MEKFQRDKEGFFICMECGELCKNLSSLARHINKFHDTKIYYDLWVKRPGEGFCLNCHKPTTFKNLKRGYLKTCCNSCSGLYNRSLWNEKSIQKRINTHIQKSKKELLEEEKNRKNTWIQKYGVENPMHSKIIFEKQQKKCFNLQTYKNSNIIYQGSYELDFLEKYYEKIPDIQKAPLISYRFKGKNKIYYPDFYIPSLNLIIEIKNSYLLRRDKNLILEKERVSREMGFKYFIIIDKDYREFGDFIYQQL